VKLVFGGEGFGQIERDEKPHERSETKGQLVRKVGRYNRHGNDWRNKDEVLESPTIQVEVVPDHNHQNSNQRGTDEQPSPQKDLLFGRRLHRALHLPTLLSNRDVRNGSQAAMRLFVSKPTVMGTDLHRFEAGPGPQSLSERRNPAERRRGVAG